MHGVTTALVAFVLICTVWPKIVVNRAQFYIGVALVLAIIVFDALAAMIGADGFRVFAYVAVAGCQLVGFVALYLSAGGITREGLKSELSGAIEVIRRGEDEKEVIIPLTGQKPMPKEEKPPERTELNDPGESKWP